MGCTLTYTINVNNDAGLAAISLLATTQSFFDAKKDVDFLGYGNVYLNATWNNNFQSQFARDSKVPLSAELNLASFTICGASISSANPPGGKITVDRTTIVASQTNITIDNG